MYIKIDEFSKIRLNTLFSYKVFLSLLCISNGATVKKTFSRFAAVGFTILLAVSGTFLLLKSTRSDQEVTVKQSRSSEEAPQDELSAPSIRKYNY